MFINLIMLTQNVNLISHTVIDAMSLIQPTGGFISHSLKFISIWLKEKLMKIPFCFFDEFRSIASVYSLQEYVNCHRDIKLSDRRNGAALKTFFLKKLILALIIFRTNREICIENTRVRVQELINGITFRLGKIVRT